MAINSRVLEPEARSMLADKHYLQSIYSQIGNYSAAEPMIRETLAIRRRTTGDNRIATAAELNNLGFLLETTGRFAEAEPIIQEALALERSQCLAQKIAVPLERFKACAAPMFL